MYVSLLSSPCSWWSVTSATSTSRSPTSPSPPCLRRRVLIIGGSFSGLAAGRDLGSHYLVTIIDAKELGSLVMGLTMAKWTQAVARSISNILPESCVLMWSPSTWMPWPSHCSQWLRQCHLPPKDSWLYFRSWLIDRDFMDFRRSSRFEGTRRWC